MVAAGQARLDILHDGWLALRVELGAFAAAGAGVGLLRTGCVRRASLTPCARPDLRCAYLPVARTRGRAQVGVTVNPVKVDSLSSFGGVDDVWVKLRAAEVAKESTKSIDLVDSGKRASSDGAAELFTYEYVLDSTRGKKHVFNAVAITGSKLYILNAQCKDKGTEETDALAADLGMVLKSFTVTAAA